MSHTGLMMVMLVEKVVLCMAVYIPPPGTLTVVMALLAAICAMPKITSTLDGCAWLRYLAVAVLCCLAAGEIFILTHEQHVGEEHFSYIVSRFDRSDKLTAALQQAQTRQSALPSKSLPQRPTISQALKRKAIDLSVSILAFLAARQAGEPPLARPETWNQDVNADTKYLMETMALYSQRFGSEVIAVHDELAKMNLYDKELDAYYEHPTNPLGVRTVAEHLGALAEQLQ
jgi:hypothetical protein